MIPEMDFATSVFYLPWWNSILDRSEKLERTMVFDQANFFLGYWLISFFLLSFFFRRFLEFTQTGDLLTTQSQLKKRCGELPSLQIKPSNSKWTTLPFIFSCSTCSENYIVIEVDWLTLFENITHVYKYSRNNLIMLFFCSFTEFKGSNFNNQCVAGACEYNFNYTFYGCSLHIVGTLRCDADIEKFSGFKIECCCLTFCIIRGVKHPYI